MKTLTEKKIKNKEAELALKRKEVNKIIKKIDELGLQKDHICARVVIAPQTLSNFLHCKEGYVTTSLIKRLNDYLETVKS